MNKKTTYSNLENNVDYGNWHKYEMYIGNCAEMDKERFLGHLSRFITQTDLDKYSFQSFCYKIKANIFLKFIVSSKMHVR